MVYESDFTVFKTMKRRIPEGIRLQAWGWGIIEGWLWQLGRKGVQSSIHGWKAHRKKCIWWLGYTNDPSTLLRIGRCGCRWNHVFDEMYEKALSNKHLSAYSWPGYAKEKSGLIRWTQSIDELRELGLYNIRPARKGKDSETMNQYVQGFKHIHPRA